MTENLLDYMLSDPECTLSEAVDYISFYLQNEPQALREEFLDDIYHAYGA